LKSEWADYLKRAGFEDIEAGDSLIEPLGSSNFTKLTGNQSQEVFSAQLNYYQWARSKLNDGHFHSDRDKLIWEYHTEGMSLRKMEERVEFNYSWISRKIKKMKTYLSEQAEAIGSMSMQMAIAR
jgi:hypothetical protein